MIRFSKDDTEFWKTVEFVLGGDEVMGMFKLGHDRFVGISIDSTPEQLDLLLAYWKKTNNKIVVEMIEMCLNAHSL
jgi:hypothetical protein